MDSLKPHDQNQYSSTRDTPRQFILLPLQNLAYTTYNAT